MELMGREQVRRIPIVDERGSLVGIVAQADIVREARRRQTGRADRRADLAAGRQVTRRRDSRADARTSTAPALPGGVSRCSVDAIVSFGRIALCHPRRPSACRDCPAAARRLGTFCSSCGAAARRRHLRRVRCARSRPARSSATAAARPPARPRPRRPADSPRPRCPWAVAAIALLALIALVAGQRFGARSRDAVSRGAPMRRDADRPRAGAPTRRGAAAHPTSRNLSPRERAERLYDRVMRLSTRRKADSVQLFAPMALAAYQMLGPLDARSALRPRPRRRGRRRHRRSPARRPTPSSRSDPTHLLGLILAARAAQLSGDRARARAASLDGSSPRNRRAREATARIPAPPGNDIDAASSAADPLAARDVHRRSLPDDRTIHVAHSPDSDDAFMFYALADGKIDTEGLDVRPRAAGHRER